MKKHPTMRAHKRNNSRPTAIDLLSEINQILQEVDDLEGKEIINKQELPIVLGLDNHDLYSIDLATSKHIAIESDIPSYQYKLQQLFLHSLLNFDNRMKVKIAWIEDTNEHTELRSRIAFFMFTKATQAEIVLPLVVEEYKRRKAENIFDTHWVVFVSDAYTTYHKHKELFNVLEGSEVQGIHLIGTSECLDKETMTVKEVMEYNSLFTPSLWMDTEGRLHHERSIIQLPFFTEKTVIPFEFYQLLDRRINEILGRTEIDLLGKSMDFQQVQRTLSSEINRYHLRSSDGRITLSLSAIRSTLDHMHQKLFYDMIERLSKNIYYFVGETPEKLTHLKELRIEPESGQVLINDKVAYTSTSEGGLVPLIVQSIYDLTLHAVSQTVTTLDQLDEATYPQLHLVTEALQRGEAYKEIAPRTTPIALLSEIEDVLSKAKFQLVRKDEPTNQEASLGITKKDIISIVKEQVNEASTNDTFFFANINKVKPVWWIEPNKDHFLGSWLLLNNKDKKEVHVFKINNNNFFEKLTTREDKDNSYRLEILTEQAPNHFIDRFSNIDFKEYYIQTIKY